MSSPSATRARTRTSRGENASSIIKVNNKVFLLLHLPDDSLHVTVKLPVSGLLALSLPFASPTGYGLGKSGWVTATFGPREQPPIEVLRQWIDESYRAVAPKKLVAGLAVQRPVRQRRQSGESLVLVAGEAVARGER